MNTPEGWKLVPVEPTQEMQSAAERYARHHNRVPFSAGYYRAMLAAAPTPPEQPAETCGLDTPLPCDIDLGGASFGKGVALRLLVKAARRWREDAYGKAPTGEVADRALAVLQGRINPQPADQALRWATELAVSMARKFYPDVPQFEPLPDLVGVISQIDNMTTGLCRKPEQPAAQGELTDEHILMLLATLCVTGENQRFDDGLRWRSIGVPSNVRQSDLLAFARAVISAAAPAIRKAERERIIMQCVPGGQWCDPQRVADDIRALPEEP